MHSKEVRVLRERLYRISKQCENLPQRQQADDENFGIAAENFAKASVMMFPQTKGFIDVAINMLTFILQHFFDKNGDKKKPGFLKRLGVYAKLAGYVFALISAIACKK